MKQQGKQKWFSRAAAWGVFFTAFSGLASAQTGAVGGGCVRARLAPVHPAEPQR